MSAPTVATPPPESRALTDAAVDKVLESCFQLLSLFFMTIGRTSEAPAAYALTSTIKRLLDHLTESGLFAAKDLESMAQTLEKLSDIVKNADAHHSPYLVELLQKRVELCQESIQNLQKKLDRLGDPLPAVHEKLISILRSMSLANTRSRVSIPLSGFRPWFPCNSAYSMAVLRIRSTKSAGAAQRNR